MMTNSLLRRLVRRSPIALLALPLVGCMSLADYGEAPGHDRGYPDYPQEADGWYGRDVASVDTFYESLARYGRWDSHPGYGQVFIPGGVRAGWQPYQDGYWATDPRFGRRWVTSEPFGWATYHYGRWARDPRLGWFWVPDTRYGPGWVSWREGSGYSGWSPLPPLGWERWGVGYNPWGWESWLFAPSGYLYRPGLQSHIVRGRPHYDRTRPIGRPDWHKERPHGRPDGWTGNSRPDNAPRSPDVRPRGERPHGERYGDGRGERPVAGWRGDDAGRPEGAGEGLRQPRPGLQRESAGRPDRQGRQVERQRVEGQPMPGPRVERQPAEGRQAAVSQPQQPAQQQPEREPQSDRRASMREMPAKQPD